jgi:transposase
MRSPKKKPFSASRALSKFKISNYWSEYNEILKKRGRIDFMIAENLSKGWYDHSSITRKRGGQKRYSDKAIFMCLQIRYLFGLRLRQTEGFINWIFETIKLPITCPDYSTLSRRGKDLNLESLLIKEQDQKYDYVSMDSSGIQMFTGNEWLENKHGKIYNRKIWKKIHIVVDNKGMIVANSTTEHNKDDRSQVETLMKDIDTNEFLADPGYDGENIYQILRKKSIKPTIRPPNNCSAENPETERQKAVAYQQNKGYQAWKTKNNYGRREQVENTFFRFKNSFGSRFLSRDNDNMKNEITIKCQLLNKMFEIGKPTSIRAF